MSHDTEKWYKIWRETDLVFQKWEEFGEFWPKYSVLKKGTDELSFMTQNSNEKFEDKTDLRFGKLHEEYCKCLPEH